MKTRDRTGGPHSTSLHVSFFLFQLLVRLNSLQPGLVWYNCGCVFLLPQIGLKPKARSSTNFYIQTGSEPECGQPPVHHPPHSPQSRGAHRIRGLPSLLHRLEPPHQHHIRQPVRGNFKIFLAIYWLGRTKIRKISYSLTTHWHCKWN